MKSDQITKFLRENVEPLKDDIYGKRYRAAVRLIDDAYLPCVVFQSRRAQVELALRRFEQLRNEPKQYRSVVASFVSSGSDLAGCPILVAPSATRVGFHEPHPLGS